ncbi:hypothetical protein P3W45_000969 [Vairimorpha bombi]|jgi:hypothetical protein
MIDSQYFEYGISPPLFHITFEFPDKNEIPEIIKLSKINYNITKNRTTRDRRFKVLSHDSFLVYNSSAYLTILGENSINVYLQTSIRKVESTPTHLYLKNKDDFISYDYTTFKIWNISVTDFCTVGKTLYTIENDKYLNMYRSEKCTKSIEMRDKCYMLRGNSYVLIAVTMNNQIIKYDQLDITKATVIDEFDSRIIDLKIHGPYLVLSTNSCLVVIDVPNKKRQKVRHNHKYKFVAIENYIVSNLYRGAYKYFDITNLQNSRTVQYDELCSDIDVYDDKLFLLSDRGIHMWSCDGKKENFFRIKYRLPYFDLSNTLFTDNCKFSLKEESEKVTRVEMGISELVNEEKRKILNTNKNEEDDTDKFNIKKIKVTKGGF